MWSSDDLNGAFYLFRLPRAWARYFAFSRKFTAGQLGLAAFLPDQSPYG